jgi:cyclomaltodextrinase
MSRIRFVLLLAISSCTAAARPGLPELELHGAEVWTSTTQLQGFAQTDAVARCVFELDGREIPAELAGRTFTAQVDVTPEHAASVRARCDTPERRTLTSATVTLHGRASAAPTARASARVEADTLLLDGSASRENASTHAALRELRWTRDGESLGEGATLRVARRDGEYTLHVRDAQGREDVSRVRMAEGRSLERASWLRGGTVYGVIPPLYGEPPLAAVRARLSDLQELGVRALWLSPVFRSPPEDFGYAVTDSFHVREEYGGDDALRALVAEAHQHGLRVLLDLVVNHSSNEHRYFREATQLGARSHYYGFYDRDEAGTVTHYFDWTHLPNFNFENPELAAWVLAFSRKWIVGGVDGYRVDAAWGVRERTPAFYAGWVEELRRIRPDAFLLAEAAAWDPYYQEQGFDAAYDWGNELGHHAWEHVFDAEPGRAERLAAAVARAPNAFHFLNNNDTGERFISRHGLALTRVATAALLTLPGIPCVYAFDEVGASFQPYQEDPPHDPHPELRALHRTLIALRRDRSAFQDDTYEARIARGELFVFTRGQGPEQVTVALNFGAQPVRVELEPPFVLAGHDFRISGGTARR